MKQITELSEIHSGYPFRFAIENVSDGKFAVIQVRDLKNHRVVDFDNLTHVNDIEPKEHHFLRHGDVIFISKGQNNYAAPIIRQVQDTIAATNFLIIRMGPGHVLPEYLSWYINQRKAQSFLRARAKGSNIPTISKSALGELQVPVPPLDAQQKIIHTQQLLEIEVELTKQIEISRKRMIEYMLMKTAILGDTNGKH